MKPFANNKVLSSTLCLLMGANLVAAQAALADVSCRDYYNAYVSEATSPTPVIVVTQHPHFHDHYAEYHGHAQYSAPAFEHHDKGRDEHHDNHDAMGTPEKPGKPGKQEEKKSDDNGDKDAAIAAAVIVSAAVTTTLVEDAKLSDANDMINIVNQAEMGDGPALRDFTAKVQSKMKSSVTVSESEVAVQVTRLNQSLAFCPGGDLSSVDELAQKIADIETSFALINVMPH